MALKDALQHVVPAKQNTTRKGEAIVLDGGLAKHLFALALVAGAGMVVLFCGAAAVPLAAQATHQTLVRFDQRHGSYPYATLVQAADGNFYGTTSQGGHQTCEPPAGGGCGLIFKITPEGKLTPVHGFNGTNGAFPFAKLVQATDGNLYGTTSGGGNQSCQDGCGTVFKITLGGTLTSLHSFDDTDGYYPTVLLQADDGNFYGTTYLGGTDSTGTVFRITSEGELTTLHNFQQTTDGFGPNALIQATDGNLYGTAQSGGLNTGGTFFKITLGGVFTRLWNFDNNASPSAGLVQASDGDFYGVTLGDGTYGGGTFYKITSEGAITILRNFKAGDPENPYAGLIQATDGDFYGTSVYGGSTNCLAGCGTVFRLNAKGRLNILYSFDRTNGYYPAGGLVQATDKTFYGTTVYGGGNQSCQDGCGTVFSLSLGLGHD
jgi:uncharacterized repeat protein (TIGR03803 family)